MTLTSGLPHVENIDGGFMKIVLGSIGVNRAPEVVMLISLRPHVCPISLTVWDGYLNTCSFVACVVDFLSPSVVVRFHVPAVAETSEYKS